MKKAFLLLAVTSGMMVACTNNASETTAGEQKTGDTTTTAVTENKQERNKKIIMASMDGISSRNVDQMLQDATPDCVDYGDGSMPPVKGKDSVKAMIQAWLNAFPDVKGDDLKYVADGDWVMVWGEWTGTFKNDFMGMKATNKSYKMKDVDIFKMNDEGKILEHHNVQSPNTMMAQIGAKPPAPKK
jgi:predicted ester cyclase